MSGVETSSPTNFGTVRLDSVTTAANLKFGCDWTFLYNCGMCDVRLERLLALLQEGHEHERLDYKEFFAAEQRSTWVEIAKDIGAMQVSGGHIVLGVDGKGKPTGGLKPEDARRLDETIVRNKIKTWVPEPFDIRVAIHEVSGCRVAMIYVAPSPDGFCIFKADGFNAGRPVFRAGDVFARHGSASERWQQADITRIRTNLREQAERRGRSHVYHVALPRTMNVIGQAEGLIREFGKACGRDVDPDRLGRAEHDEICAAVRPHGAAPMVVGLDQKGEWIHATWWIYLQRLRVSSREITNGLQIFSAHLDPEHVALLATIDQCPYFSQLSAIGDMQPTNNDFCWLSGPMWDYFQDIKSLKAYVQRKERELAKIAGET